MRLSRKKKKKKNKGGGGTEVGGREGRRWRQVNKHLPRQALGENNETASVCSQIVLQIDSKFSDVDRIFS